MSMIYGNAALALLGCFMCVFMVLTFIALLVKPNMGTGLVFTGLCIAFFVCIIISLNVSLRYMSGLELTLILGTLCVGIAFVIKGLFGVRKLDRDETRKNGKAASNKLHEYDKM